MFANWLPLLGLMLFLFVGVLWRGWLQYRRYGHVGIVLFRTAGLRRKIRDSLFCLLVLALMGQALVFALSSTLLSGLLIKSVTVNALTLGAIVMLAGLLLTVAAQLGMGVSWRIGIDDNAAPGLVTSGLYQFCRNPIYLGMLSSLIGLAIMLPTWLSLVLVLGVFWCVRTQTIEEEAYLARTYGGAFHSYAARVGRFWPGLGRLRPTLPGRV